MDDRDVMLISLVQKHPHLYDKNTNYFKDRTAVDTSWKMIALAMKTSGMEDDCQRRWCVLRNRYAKERREQNKPDCQKKIWPLMSLMSFLDEHVKRRRSYRAMNDIQDAIMSKPRRSDSLLLSKPEKWEEIIIDEDEEEDQEPDIKHVLSDADHSNASSYFVDEEITIYKQPFPKLPEMQPAPRIVSTTTIENEAEIPSTTIEKAVDITVPVIKNDIAENTQIPKSDDSNMHFCLSLQESMQKVPKKYLTKAKIEILQVLDKYENAQ